MLYSINFNNKTEDKTSYVSRVNALTFENLVKEMKKKDHVYIVSCYYGIDALNKFLDKIKGGNRTTKVIVSAVGPSSQNWISQVKTLLDKNEGIKLHRNQNVFLYTKHSLLHSKIYLSKSSRRDWVGQARCFIGSANLSENAFNCNEEILADITDCSTKKAINAYIDVILRDKDHLYSLRDLKKRYEKEGDKFDLEALLKTQDNHVNTLAEYFLSGKLVFKCLRNFSLGFGDSEWRNEIRETSASGFVKKNKTLDISSILGYANFDSINDGNEDFSEDTDTDEAYYGEFKDDSETISKEAEENNAKNNGKSRENLTIRSNSVETCFGYWVPQERLDIFEKLVPEYLKKDSPLKQKYEMIHNALEENSVNLSETVKNNLENAFKEVSLPLKRYEHYRKKIIEHIKQRKIFYEKNKNLYLMKGFCITPMPNIFDDPVATQEFLNSLWDDICFRSKCTPVTKSSDEKILCRKLYTLLYDKKLGGNKMLKLTSQLNKIE